MLNSYVLQLTWVNVKKTSYKPNLVSFTTKYPYAPWVKQMLFLVSSLEFRLKPFFDITPAALKTIAHIKSGQKLAKFFFRLG